MGTGYIRHFGPEQPGAWKLNISGVDGLGAWCLRLWTGLQRDLHIAGVILGTAWWTGNIGRTGMNERKRQMRYPHSLSVKHVWEAERSRLAVALVAFAYFARNVCVYVYSFSNDTIEHS